MFSKDVEEEPVIESLAQLSKGALSDLAGVFAAMQEDALDALIEEIVKAKRIVVFGLGREGLQMRGFGTRRSPDRANAGRGRAQSWRAHGENA